MNTSLSTARMRVSSARDTPMPLPISELFHGTMTSDFGASWLPRIDMPDIDFGSFGRARPAAPPAPAPPAPAASRGAGEHQCSEHELLAYGLLLRAHAASMSAIQIGDLRVVGHERGYAS